MTNQIVSTLKRWGGVALTSAGNILIAVIGYIVIIVIVFHGLFVWTPSAGVGFFIFGENNKAAATFANETTSISLVVFTIILAWAVKEEGGDRGFATLVTGWFAAAFFTGFFLILSWIAPSQIPSPQELAVTVSICASTAAFLKAIGHN